MSEILPLPPLMDNGKPTLVEKPPFLTKSFQLHDICNYVSIGIFEFLNKIMAITN
jgi:hypothetical protein